MRHAAEVVPLPRAYLRSRFISDKPSSRARSGPIHVTWSSPTSASTTLNSVMPVSLTFREK